MLMFTSAFADRQCNKYHMLMHWQVCFDNKDLMQYQTVTSVNMLDKMYFESSIFYNLIEMYF